MEYRDRWLRLPPEERASEFLRSIAPLAHPDSVRGMAAQYGAQGWAFPFEQERLNKWERTHLLAYCTDQTYDRKQVYDVLRNRREALEGHLARSQGDADTAVHMLLQLPYFIVSRMESIHGMRLDPVGYREVAGRVENPFCSLIDSMRPKVEQEMPELAKALWPSVDSLFMLEQRFRKHAAGQQVMPGSMPQPSPSQQSDAARSFAPKVLHTIVTLLRGIDEEQDPELLECYNCELRGLVEAKRKQLGISKRQIRELDDPGLVAWLRANVSGLPDNLRSNPEGEEVRDEDEYQDQDEADDQDQDEDEDEASGPEQVIEYNGVKVSKSVLILGRGAFKGAQKKGPSEVQKILAGGPQIGIAAEVWRELLTMSDDDFGQLPVVSVVQR